MNYEKLKISAHELLSNIERNLPSDCELLIRTNHDPDGLSGISKEEGKWYVHLMSSKGHKSKNNVEHKSLYSECGNDLFQLLCEVGSIVSKHCAEQNPTEINCDL